MLYERIPFTQPALLRSFEENSSRKATVFMCLRPDKSQTKALLLVGSSASAIPDHLGDAKIVMQGGDSKVQRVQCKAHLTDLCEQADTPSGRVGIEYLQDVLGDSKRTAASAQQPAQQLQQQQQQPVSQQIAMEPVRAAQQQQQQQQEPSSPQSQALSLDSLTLPLLNADPSSAIQMTPMGKTKLSQPPAHTQQQQQQPHHKAGKQQQQLHSTAQQQQQQQQ